MGYTSYFSTTGYGGVGLTMALLSKLDEFSIELLKQLRREAFIRGETSIISLLNSAIVTDRISTMGTTGSVLYLNPVWTQQVGPKKALGVLVHELLHDAFEHHSRPWAIYTKDDLINESTWKDIVNIAMDVIINDEVLKLGYDLPEGGQFRSNLKIPPQLKSSYKVFNYLLEAYKDSEELRRKMLEIIKELKEKEQERNTLIALPKVKQPSKVAIKQPQQPSNQRSPQQPQQDKKESGVNREQLITMILRDQKVYGGNSD